MAHDPMCGAVGPVLAGCICVQLRERDARVRADERERMADLARKVQGGGIRDYEAEVRERLRAQVEALRHEDECDVSRGRERPETGRADCNCLRADVLALLGGEHRAMCPWQIGEPCQCKAGAVKSDGWA